MANEFIARKGLIALNNSSISGSLDVSGSLTIESSGSTLFEVIGSEGQLFSITDSLSGSLFAVSDVSGLPILEVFSDDTVKIGSFNNEAITVSGSHTTIGGTLAIPGFTNVSASLAAAIAGGDDLGNHTASLDLNMGGNAITNVGNVDGVDVSALNSTVSTNTSNITTLTAATSSYLTTVDISDDTNLTAGTGITLTGDTLSTNDSQIIHDNLSGFVANEHIDHSTVSITAGNGLTGGGTIVSTRTLNVGAGDGISVAADSVAVDSTVLRTTGDSVLSSSAQIASDISGAFTAGGGISLSGGEFSVSAGTGLTQGATGLSFDADGGTLTTNNADVDHILINDGGTFKRITKGNINVGDFNNNVGYLTTVDISTDTNLVGGTNLTLSGDTMNLDANISLTNITASGNVDINGTLSLGDFADVSASLAAAVAGGDNLGNHTATQNLNMGTYAITNVGNVDGVDVSTLKSDFDTLEGKTLVSGSSQIASDISGSFTSTSASIATDISNAKRLSKGRITFLYTGSVSYAPPGYIAFYDLATDNILINTSSYNGVDLDASVANNYAYFQFNEPGSLITVRKVSDGSFKTYKVISATTNYTGNADNVGYLVDGGTFTNVMESGSISDGDEVEFIWDKSAGVGGAYGPTVNVAAKTFANFFQPGYNYLDMFFGRATDTEYDGDPENLSGVAVSSSFTDSSYFLPAISQSATLTLGGLTVNGNITVTGNVDGVDVSTLKSDFDTLEGKTLISSSAQINHDATTNFDAAEHFTQANITTVGTVTSGDVSAILPSGTVSSSAQILPIATSSITDFPTEVSRSAAAAGFSSGGGGGGNVSNTGTPVNDQIAVWTDSTTIEGTTKLTFENSTITVHSTNADNTGIEIYGGVYPTVTSWISPVGASNKMNFGDGTSGHIFDFLNNKIAFDGDSTNTYIQANTDTPEDLEIHADQDIILAADNAVVIGAVTDVEDRISSYRTQIVSNGFYGQADLRYLTFNTTGETTGFNYLSLMPAPANGRVISISVWPQANGGSTVMGFHLNSNATPASTDTQTLTAGTPVTFTFSSGNTFSQNDELSFSVDPTSTPNGLFFSIILEYDY